MEFRKLNLMRAAHASRGSAGASLFVPLPTVVVESACPRPAASNVVPCFSAAAGRAVNMKMYTVTWAPLVLFPGKCSRGCGLEG